MWTITSGVVSLSCHAVKTPTAAAAGVLSEIREVLHDRFGIDHVTVQVESDDMETSLRANLDRIDDLFINTLAVNLQHAEQSDMQEDVDKLTQLGDMLMKLIQESQPPEIAFINQLLSAEYPAGTLALLEENRQQVTVRLIETMRVVEKDLTQSGREQVAQRLAEIREQATTLVA